MHISKLYLIDQPRFNCKAIDKEEINANDIFCEFEWKYKFSLNQSNFNLVIRIS